jgi:Ca2+-binding EF-hand superfamily protein
MIVIVKDCFQELFDLENGLELTRKELSYQRDFTLIAAFNTFAKSMQQRVSLEEFSFGLDRLDFILLPSDVKLFFERYDSDQDGKLGFWELSNSLLPIEIRQRDELENR